MMTPHQIASAADTAMATINMACADRGEIAATRQQQADTAISTVAGTVGVAASAAIATGYCVLVYQCCSGKRDTVAAISTAAIFTDASALGVAASAAIATGY